MAAATVPFRVSCDSLVALPVLTRRGRTIFAKNSDRPPEEAQPLIQVAPAEHAPGSKVRCQYLEIEQVARTRAFLGSRPYWLWGCEHGVNELGVAVGNHTIYTKDSLGETGLLGMDLVRLALERSASAREAADVITSLVERHGQGGSGFVDLLWPYHNSFLLADAAEAFLLECSDRQWALERLEGGGSASNHTAIGDDWEALSDDCIAHAVANGWWTDADRRFDFAEAYRDESVVPAIVSSGRFRTTCGALTRRHRSLDVAAIKRVMRDHYENGELHAPVHAADDERFFSVCMHAGAVGMTAASMIVELAAPCESGARLVWTAFCNPCVAPYLPVFPEAPMPAEFAVGERSPDGGGAWWRFKRLLTAVERDFPRHAGPVREAWRQFEHEIEPRAEALAVQVAALGERERRDALAGFMQETWDAAAAKLDELTASIES
jgi:secernin